MTHSDFDAKDSFSLVCKKVQKALDESARSDQVTIVGAAKQQNLNRVKSALKQGLTHIGESYLREGLDRQKDLKDQNHLKWHFIGKLQSKKIKDIVEHFDYIHSVSRLKEIDLIQEAAANLGLQPKIFIQVNIAKEESKNGCAPEEAKEAFLYARKQDHIHCLGLMVMPPLCNNELESRKYFSQAKILMDELDPKGQLSMGTSSDYEGAIKEGSHFIRLGTTIFGER